MAKPGSYKYLRWGSYVVIIAAIFAIVSSLPLDTLSSGLKQWVESLGIWGPVALGAIYIVATILFVPGTILTLVAGAVFGLTGRFHHRFDRFDNRSGAGLLDREVLRSGQGCSDGPRQSKL